MSTLSTRTLAALAFERGEEFDPALMPTPELVEDLATAGSAMPLVGEPGSYERRRRRERERRLLARVPDWFSADDLVSRGEMVIHDEPV